MTSDNSTQRLPSIESTSHLISNDGFRNVLPQQRMSRSPLCEKPYGSVLTPVQLTLKCYSQGNLAPATARGGSYTRRKRCYTARLTRPSGSCTKFERANALRFPAEKASYSWASSASSTSSSKSGRSRAASRDEVKEIVKKLEGFISESVPLRLLQHFLHLSRSKDRRISSQQHHHSTLQLHSCTRNVYLPIRTELPRTPQS